jgi:hypothetical protein
MRKILIAASNKRESLCRLQHQRPTSDEGGMRDDLTRTHFNPNLVLLAAWYFSLYGPVVTSDGLLLPNRQEAENRTSVRRFTGAFSHD